MIAVAWRRVWKFLNLQTRKYAKFFTLIQGRIVPTRIRQLKYNSEHSTCNNIQSAPENFSDARCDPQNTTTKTLLKHCDATSSNYHLHCTWSISEEATSRPSAPPDALPPIAMLLPAACKPVQQDRWESINSYPGSVYFSTLVKQVSTDRHPTPSECLAQTH